MSNSRKSTNEKAAFVVNELTRVRLMYIVEIHVVAVDRLPERRRQNDTVVLVHQHGRDGFPCKAASWCQLLFPQHGAKEA